MGKKTKNPINVAASKQRNKLEGEYSKLDYWHGLLPNEDTANLLKTDGDFLLRGTIKNEEYYMILSVRWGKNVLNCAIVQSDIRQGYSFQGHFYGSVQEIVDSHHIRKLPLVISGVSAILETPVRRKVWELRQSSVKLGKELGAGSYGTVYRGILFLSLQPPINVAVKVLTEMTAEASNALWKEARYQQSFNHENVVKMYGVANDSLPYFLVMECVKGGSLDKFLMKKTKKLKDVDRVKILLDGAKGLEYLHDQNCIHRDVATRNMLVDDVIKVADFGMSRKCSSYKVDTNKPLNLRWLDPSVFKSQIVTKTTDVYAFGITMYEVFGDPFRIPYEEMDANMVYDKVIEGDYRLSMHEKAPVYIKQLFNECIGAEKDRPNFSMIVVCLSNYTDNRGMKGMGIGV